MILLTIFGLHLLFGCIGRVYAKLTLGICTCNEKLIGRTVLITGASKGVGYSTAKELAKRGAKIIITSRNLKECEKARCKLVEETGNTNIIAKALDFDTLYNIRSFAKDILKTEERLDILINNAGSSGTGRKYSSDGILQLIQINYLGAFLLTNLLLGLLKKTPNSRIINVSSIAHRCEYYDVDNINTYTLPLYFDHLVYNNAKLFIIYMTVYMAEKLKDTTTTINCLHPGISPTDLVQNATKGCIPYYKFMWKYILGPYFMFSGFKTPDESAQTAIHLAVSKKVENVTGKYFSDCKQQEIKADTNPEIIKKIWNQSVKLVQLLPEEIHI